MAIRTATAAITLTDLADGQSSVSAFLTNENHTFAANDAGVVSDATRRDFSCNVKVFVGGSAQTFTTGTPSAGQFTIGSISAVSGWEFQVSQTNGFDIGGGVTKDAGTIYADAVGVPSSASIVVPVTYNNNGTVGSFNLELSVNRIQDGAGGTVIKMVPSSQMFSANADGELLSGQSASTILFDIAGNPGELSYETSLDGAPFQSQTATSADAGGISGFDNDASGAFSTGTLPNNLNSNARLEIQPSNLGDSAETLSVRVSGEQGKDAVTFAKVRAGRAAVYVEVTANGPTVFRNNSGDPVTLTANVFDANDGSQLTDGVGGVTIAYDWEFVTGEQVFVATDSLEVQTDASGAPLSVGRSANGVAFNTNQVIVSPSNIPDTGVPISIRCVATVTTP
jgi:hypothetical protein